MIDISHYQNAILELAKSEHAGWEQDIRRITEISAGTLQVERVSVWLFTPDRSRITCVDLHSLTAKRHEKGLTLQAEQYPRYFRALEKSRTLAAHRARSDLRTSEFTKEYLIPYGITSMLDVPVRFHGRMVGIVCHEHTGPARHWSREEQEFAGTIADMVSLAMAANEIRRTDAALRKKTHELERSNRQLEQFATMVSHDLQEPLLTIIGFLDRLHSRCGTRLDDVGQDYLARMQRAAQHMNQLIEDLLVFTRITSRVATRKKIDLNQLIDEVLSDLAASLTAKHGDVAVGTLPSVYGDPRQMHQLFQNLISNAIKFSKKGEAPHIDIAGHDVSPQEVEISVHDNGIGFERRYRNKIFEPFQRLHGWSVYEGSGLGLSICQKITESHGGHINAVSSPGHGSTFSVFLPHG